jgi:hypothetical protein
MPWSDDQKRKLRLEYLRIGEIRCPEDQALLRVQEAAGMGKPVTLHVSCPVCRTNEVLRETP